MDRNNTIYIVQAAAIIACCAIAGFLYLFAARTVYDNTANKHWKNKRYILRVGNPANSTLADSCTQLLRTGDLVVRRGDDMTSYMLSQLNLEDKTYSHCGLVVTEQGQPYVYHCIGGEDNPNQKMKKETARQWFSPENNHGFAVYRYDLNDSSIRRLTNQLYTYYARQVMFDMDFDLNTDDRLYCSEMIYKVICTATSNPRYFIPENNYGRTFIGIDNLYLHPHARQVCEVRFK